ncbi:hypothetical protein TL16_g08226 [Triparma laevis f. inornata]|uniref:Uncharacterized protein n=2 Tax=Triparma laevis TaxID=1534972 RepID=A0A9W7F3P3_9STRA|nr:hypothetical protein TL16_g08226 [Triparma laevis f. inornata]GMI01046.1 hypothetical protein TrLO_g485 [Triparma laevis f. longispina]
MLGIFGHSLNFLMFSSSPPPLLLQYNRYAPPLKGKEDEYVDLFVICVVNVPDAQMRLCGHFMICRVYTQELMTRSEPCPICRKPISSFEVCVYCESLGAHGLWMTSYKNLRQLASGKSFHKYFQKLFVGNEEPYLRWKEVFDVLEIVGGMGCHHNVRVYLETQVLSITRSEGLVKLRALVKLCSRDFFDDRSLLVVAWRRIFEVLVLAMPPVMEKKVRGNNKKKKQQKKKNDPRKLEILDACFALGNACNEDRSVGILMIRGDTLRKRRRNMRSS